ncbi:MAG: hypothetical protein EU531_09940 [Promethearchaeota archaeon]|nr:MAG: hypothetical protein EU531_09940 [Candidatus Lokiarchaeota archaeon]
MTITWGFTFTSLLYFFPFLFDALRFLIPSVFIYLYSSHNSREVKNLNYIKISTLLNFILIGIFFFIPFPIMITNIFDSIIFNLFMIGISTISNLVLIVSFGFLILLFGINNKELFGPYLQYSGMIFIFAFFSRLFLIQPIGYYVPLLSYLLYFAGNIDVLGQILFPVLLGPFSMLLIIGMVYMIIHGYKNSEKYLVFAGLSYLISFAFIGYGTIPTHLFMFS